MVLQSTLHVTGQATGKLTKVTSDLNNIVTSLVALADGQAQILATIAEKEAELAELDTKLSETRRQKEVELQIALKENSLAKVNEVLLAQGRTSIPTEELTKLRNDYSDLVKDFDTKLGAEVAKTKAIATSATTAAR